MLWREQGKTPQELWVTPKAGGPSSGWAFATFRQFGHRGLSHGVGMLHAGESSCPHFVCIGFDCLLDRGAELAEALDEFGHARRQAEHIFEHQDLTIAGGAGADADSRNGAV